MNAVLGLSRLLSDTPLSLEQDQYLSMITNSGHLLLTIINDILDFSKIDSGNLKLEKNMHSLVDAVETAVLLCHDAASTKGLDLHYWVQPDAPHAFFVDASRLQQILLNLLSNAIKFTQIGQVGLSVSAAPVPAVAVAVPAPHSARLTSDSGSAGTAGQRPRGLSGSLGSLSLSSPVRHLTSSSPHSSTSSVSTASSAASASSSQLWELTFHVRDQGIGISDADMSKLFQSFSQASHISSKYGGTVRSTAGCTQGASLLCSCCCFG